MSEHDSLIAVHSAAASTRQAEVVIEKVKQLGCWPEDFRVTPVQAGSKRGHVYVETGLAKGRRRCLRVDMDGRTTA